MKSLADSLLSNFFFSTLVDVADCWSSLVLTYRNFFRVQIETILITYEYQLKMTSSSCKVWLIKKCVEEQRRTKRIVSDSEARKPLLTLIGFSGFGIDFFIDRISMNFQGRSFLWYKFRVLSRPRLPQQNPQRGIRNPLK